MNRQAAVASLLLLAATRLLGAAEAVIEIGSPAAPSRVPRWDARGLGPLPWQAVACLDVSEDGGRIAVGTIAPAGDPNLLLLDAGGKIVGRHHAGLRWPNEVAVSDDGRFVAALCTTPEGTAGDTPRFYAFLQGKELDQLSGGLDFQGFRPARFMVHYGSHSNHLPRISRWAGQQWVVAGDDVIYWLSPTGHAPPRTAHLGQGVTTAMAASAAGPAVVGRYAFGSFDTPGEAARGAGGPAGAGKFPTLLVVKPAGSKPIVWSRPGREAAPATEPERGIYGPAVPPYDDVKFPAPLAVAIDAAGQQIAAADYQGWQRVFHPRDGGPDIPFGTRFMPSRPTIHVYTAEGRTVRRVPPEALGPFWCDLGFSADGRKLLIWPHNWTSRGLAGQPLLPADEDARNLYVLDIAGGGLECVRFPDAIASLDAGGGDRVAVGCWDHKVYLLDKGCRPIAGLPHGLDVGAASLVRVSRDGRRIVAASAAGSVWMLDGDGKELWRTDLNKAAVPGDKPWTRNQKADRLGPGVWRTNGSLAHSDMGSQILIEAPQGLILIDPNSAASLEQNWARIEGAGLDPKQVKYVLPTHEHGDHAPGAYLWRVITGAQVVASAEMAYVLQHHIPGGTGYGFHPPQPVDVVLTADQEIELAGLRLRALRLPGHTAGSMGYAFQKEGRTYVATGDLMMPGGLLGYSGSLDFSAQDALASMKKLSALGPDVVLGGHGGGRPDDFIAAGIAAGEATGWSRMTPPKPNPLYRFTQSNYLVAAWLEPILSAAYGDVDGDGRPDVAVLVPKRKGSAVKIYLNQGGKFNATPDAEIDLPELGGGWKLRMLHPGGSKAADFFVSSENQAVLLRCQPQLGRLRFKAVPLAVVRGSQVATGDFHGGGKADLVIGSRFVQGYSVACQRDDGTFRIRQTKAPAEMYMDIQLADVNGDKRDDLITSCGDIFLRQPDGSLAETPAFHLTPPSGESKGWTFLAAADFDHDGWTDVALLANGKDGVIVWLYRNTRDPHAPFPAEPSAKFVVPDAVVNRDGPTVADIDGDGIPDLILERKSKPGLAILTGAAGDGLSPRRIVSVKLDYTPHFDTRLGAADFSGDARIGLAGFGPSPTGAIGVYIWVPPAAPGSRWGTQ
jgi:metallo-beta-lactamase class B